MTDTGARCLLIHTEAENNEIIIKLSIFFFKIGKGNKRQLDKGSCHLRFSGFCPLKGGGGPPFPLRKKTFFLGLKTLFFAFFMHF